MNGGSPVDPPPPPAPPAPSGRLRLVLDEMHNPTVAALLRDRGHDVVSVAEIAELRAMPDSDLISRATSEGRWIVTENISDFRRLIAVANETGETRVGIVLTSPRTFPRSRSNIARLVDALDALVTGTPAEKAPPEIWLRPAP